MRLFIADDEARVRSALRLFIEQDLDKVIVKEAETIDQLWAGMSDFKPDVIFLDWELPGLNEEDPLRRIRIDMPSTIVIAISGKLESRKTAYLAGVNGFISKNDPPEKILETIAHLTCIQTESS